MTKEPKVIECFIPAQALEHPLNGEYFTLKDKLCAAVNRLIQAGSLNEFINVKVVNPYILIQYIVFNPIDLGYYVRAKIC